MVKIERAFYSFLCFTLMCYDIQAIISGILNFNWVPHYVFYGRIAGALHPSCQFYSLRHL